jgi:hypothetical protein
MHTGFSSQVTGFMLEIKSVEVSPKKMSCSAPDPAPDRTIRRQIGPVWRATAGSLACVSAPGQNILAGHRMSGLQPDPAGLIAGPSGLHFGGAKLIAKPHRELLPMARFPPPYKTLLLAGVGSKLHLPLFIFEALTYPIAKTPNSIDLLF